MAVIETTGSPPARLAHRPRRTRVRISTHVILATIVGAYRPYVDMPAFRAGMLAWRLGSGPNPHENDAVQAEAWHRGACAAIVYQAALKRFSASMRAVRRPSSRRRRIGFAASSAPTAGGADGRPRPAERRHARGRPLPPRRTARAPVRRDRRAGPHQGPAAPPPSRRPRAGDTLVVVPPGAARGDGTCRRYPAPRTTPEPRSSPVRPPHPRDGGDRPPGAKSPLGAGRAPSFPPKSFRCDRRPSLRVRRR